MKNFKRLTAALSAVTLAATMSISAFADAPSISEEKTTLNIGTGITTVNGEYTTMMAYVVPGILGEEDNVPAYDADLHTMIALDQVDGTTGIASVPVDANKLADGNTIVVKIGGSTGELATYLITMAKAETYTITLNYNGGTVDDATGTNPATFGSADTIATFFTNITAPTKVDATGAVTYTFKGWAKSADSTDVIDTTSTDLMTSLLDDEGQTSLTLYAIYEEKTASTGKDPISFTYGDVTGDGYVKLADYNAVKVYVTKGSHPKYTNIETEAAEGYVYGDVTGDGYVKLADYNAIKVYVTKGSHPKYTNIGKTEQVQPE